MPYPTTPALPTSSVLPMCQQLWDTMREGRASFWWTKQKKEGKHESSRYPVRTKPNTILFLYPFFYAFFVSFFLSPFELYIGFSFITNKNSLSFLVFLLFFWHLTLLLWLSFFIDLKRNYYFFIKIKSSPLRSCVSYFLSLTPTPFASLHCTVRFVNVKAISKHIQF